jgi:GNAT superfamily N-acetyltransferase
VSGDLARGALAGNESQFALGNESFVAAGARFVRNREFPAIRDANHVAHVTASSPSEIDELLERMGSELGHAPARTFHCDFTTPPALEARLVLDGWRSSACVISVLEGDVAGPSRAAAIDAVRTDAHWRALRELKAADWDESCRRVGEAPDAAIGEGLFATRRLKCPPGRYFLATDDGLACGFVSALPGLQGMGQVEDLYVAPSFRSRGLARELIRRAVRACREGGAGPVVIAADAADTPRHAYARMGFRPVAVKREYWKH